jgi:hypothetical protein
VSRDTPPSVPLKVERVYLAGWEIRVDQLPIEEFMLDLGDGNGATSIAARAPRVMTIAKGGLVAATFTLINEEYNAGGVIEFQADCERTAPPTVPDWCIVDDCPSTLCNGPHLEHDCKNDTRVTVRYGTACPICGFTP